MDAAGAAIRKIFRESPRLTAKWKAHLRLKRKIRKICPDWNDEKVYRAASHIDWWPIAGRRVFFRELRRQGRQWTSLEQ